MTSILVCLLACGCSDGKGTDTDAGDATADGEDIVEEFLVTVEPPAPPALPVLTPCPDGWREVEDTETGVTTCDPWPETGREDCGPGEAHFPGEPSCATVGDPCPTGIWPEGLPTDRHTVYVDPAATPGGDGTQDSPFTSIIDAFRDSGYMSIIALAKGTHEACLNVPATRTLWGACAAETIITCPTHESPGGVVVVQYLDVEIRNVTITGERTGIWLNGPDASLVVDGVIVDGTLGGGISAVHICEATIHDFVARDIRPLSSNGQLGRGIDAYGGSTTTASRVALERVSNEGIVCANDGTSVTVEDIAIVDTQESPIVPETGVGVWTDLGGHFSATRIVVEDCKGAGIYVAAGTGEITDCVVRDTTFNCIDRACGFGIDIFNAAADVTRCLLERNRAVAITYDGSSGSITDIVARDTMPLEGTSEWGRGLNSHDGSNIVVLRALFHNNHDIGVVIGTDTGSLTDVTITATQPLPSEGGMGQGLHVFTDSHLTGERILIADNRNSGLILEGGSAVITDIEISGTLPTDDPEIEQGFGIAMIEGADLGMTRAFIHDNHEIGIVMEGATGTFQHLRVIDTMGRESTGEWGRALHVQIDSQAYVSNAVFSNNREMSIGAFHPGSLIEMQDVEVNHTLQRDCAETTCPDAAAGVGVGSYAGAHINLTRFFVINSALAGLQLAHSQAADGTSATICGTMELHDGEVAHNPVGINVQDPEFDVELLMDNVSYHNNGTNLDSTFLPVPGMGDIGLSP